MLLVYVDDIIVIGDDEKEKLMLKQYMVKEFEIKEFGKLKYFLLIYLPRLKSESSCFNKNISV